MEHIDKEKVSVYETKQFLGYRRLNNFVVDSMSDGIMTEVSETELNYENEDIFLKVTTIGDFKSFFRYILMVSFALNLNVMEEIPARLHR